MRACFHTSASCEKRFHIKVLFPTNWLVAKIPGLQVFSCAGFGNISVRNMVKKYALIVFPRMQQRVIN